MSLDIRSSRNKVGPPPWGTYERRLLVKRITGALYRRAAVLGTLPAADLGGLKFLGYGGAELLEHLERRHAQGCLVCGDTIAPDAAFEICHIDPLAVAHDAVSLSVLMQLTNIGLAHVSCNRRLGSRPLR